MITMVVMVEVVVVMVEKLEVVVVVAEVVEVVVVMMTKSSSCESRPEREREK